MSVGFEILMENQAKSSTTIQRVALFTGANQRTGFYITKALSDMG
jgi:hypothetical protein